MSLRYCVDYAVELFDHVDVRVEGHEHSGVVTRIHPKLRLVTVRYTDELGRSTGEPRVKVARVPMSAVDLVARDG